MLNQTYLFQLMREHGIDTIAELSRILDVNYFTLRYDLTHNTLRLQLAVLLANFFDIPVSSLLISEQDHYICCVLLHGRSVEYEIVEPQNMFYLMFCILSSELL